MRRVARYASLLSAVVLAVPTAWAIEADGPVRIEARETDSPLVLDQNTDYVLDRVEIRGLADVSALTLTGDIKRVEITNSRFGQIVGAAIGLLGIWLLTVALSPQG